MASGLRCPKCGTWYNSDKQSAMHWKEGDVCGNEAFTEAELKKPSTVSPCPGILVLNTDEMDTNAPSK